MKGGDGYELHFCTVKQEKGTTVNSWYRWFLGQDFFKTLKNYGRLPLEMNFETLMITMKEKDEVTKERDELTKERDDMIKKKELEMQEKIKLSLEERDFKLFDVMIDSIKEKSSQ